MLFFTFQNLISCLKYEPDSAAVTSHIGAMPVPAYLFYIGVLVPTIVTVLLFIIFIICWFKFNLRQKIMNRRYDPHGKQKGPVVVAPPSYHQQPIPEESAPHTTDTFPQTTDTQGAMYSTFHDSGMSELHEIQYKNFDRPVSQASTDSEDSGFRSSKSAHYLQGLRTENSILHDVPLLRSLINSRDEQTKFNGHINSACYSLRDSCRIPASISEHFTPRSEENNRNTLYLSHNYAGYHGPKTVTTATVHKELTEPSSHMSFTVV